MITKKTTVYFECDCGHCGQYGPVIQRFEAEKMVDVYKNAVKSGWIFYRNKYGNLKTFYSGCLEGE